MKARLAGQYSVRLTALCWAIFRRLQFYRYRLLLISLAGFLAVYSSTNRYMIYRFLPEERGFLPKMTKETLVCERLIKVAKLILDGEPISLPFVEKTLWKFRERASKQAMKRNVVGQELNESAAETLKWRKMFNLSSSDTKGRKIFITFGHNCCAFSKQRALAIAKTVGGFDYAYSFNFDSIPARFRANHNDVLKSRRGAGYWLWKPYIILKSLVENMNEGDLLLYQDAGAYLVRSAGPLLKLCEQDKEGIIIFRLSKIEQEYTKKDAFILMNMSIPEASETFQRLASFVVVRKSCASVQFVMEWLAYLSDRRIASDDHNTLGVPNPKCFRDHRHDQSVISLLSKKWGLRAYRDPSQYGETVPSNSYYSLGPYKQLFIHDRLKS